MSAKVLLDHNPLAPSNAAPVDFAAAMRTRPAWITPEQPRPLPEVTAYRLHFDLPDAAQIRVHVSADERYLLYVDGQAVGRGPERGSDRAWFYESYDLPLSAGAHTFVALVWQLGEIAPRAQVGLAGGFLLEAEGEHGALLSTKSAAWTCKPVDGLSFDMPAGMRHVAWFVEPIQTTDGARYPWGIERGEGDGWQPVTHRREDVAFAFGIHAAHVLQPALLPEQMAVPWRGGRVRSVDAAAWDDPQFIVVDAETEPVADAQHIFHVLLACDEQPRTLIAVGSGKGGVGKSTVSVNLALALADVGYEVGLLDVDVYGPSIPLMLGVDGHPLINAKQKLVPNEKHNLKIMSMGFLLKPNQAVVWRGPMVHGVVKQFLQDVDWGELDFLIVDLPPGTGDAPLSLTQSLPLTATVLVTTPQEVAASVAAKAMTMFERMGIRTLGVIENMSYFICPSCETATDIFDRGGGKLLASDAGVPFLGEIPLDVRMRKGSDVGEPLMAQFPDSELAERFREIARRLAGVLGAQVGTTEAGEG